jgi:hypothetical protein
MDWELQQLGKASGVSGRSFEPGDTVLSCLYRGADGTLARIDYHFDEEPPAIDAHAVICRWQQRVRPRLETAADKRRNHLLSVEELFLALAESLQEDAASVTPPTAAAAVPDVPDAASAAERQALLGLLVLQLERRRVLRPLGGERWLHVRTKTVYRIPHFEVTPEALFMASGLVADA